MHHICSCFPRSALLRLLVCVLCLTAVSPGLVNAQSSLEVIPLQHRLVEDVLPVLQPLVEPGGSLSGFNNQLFLRISPRNSAEIRQALAAIDTPIRRLVIWVATDREALDNRRSMDISARNGQINTRVNDTRNTRAGRNTQMIQTIEGGRAFIQTGVSVAVPLHRTVAGQGSHALAQERVEFRDIGQGFFAEPRLRGDQVIIDISQQVDTLRRQGQPGSADIQRLSTQVSGRLGEWIALGNMAQQSDERSRENISLSNRSSREDQGIWLRVEEIP